MLVRPVAAVVPMVLVAIEGAGGLRRSASATGIGRVPVGAAALAATVAVLLAPWVVRNARVHHVFMPATAAAGFPGLQGDLALRGLPVPVVTYALLARPGLTGHDDHAYVQRIIGLVDAHMPRATAGDLVKLQFARARMLGQALTTPFTFPGPPVPVGSVPFVLQSALLALALVGLFRLRRVPRSLFLLAGSPPASRWTLPGAAAILDAAPRDRDHRPRQWGLRACNGPGWRSSRPSC